MNYNDAADALAYDAAFWAMAFEDEHYDLSALGTIAVELGQKLRALGILGLLATGDSAHLHNNLRLSGEYRVKYLQRVASSARDDQHHYTRGRVNPVFDLITAGDNALLTSLIQASPAAFQSQREYLPDYCYVNLLAGFSLADALPPFTQLLSTQASLKLYEQWLDGETDPRFDLCKAIADGNEAGFLDAFDRLLAQRVEHIEERRHTVLEDAVVATERFIFVEGLAVLTIARRHSFDVDQDFALCPYSAWSGPGVKGP